jgi:hypothetical protein
VFRPIEVAVRGSSTTGVSSPGLIVRWFVRITTLNSAGVS